MSITEESPAGGAEPYTIDVDLGAQTLVMRLRGFWTGDVVDRFADDLGGAVTALGRVGVGPGDFVTLADVREHPVQSQEVAKRLREITGTFGSGSRRIANLLSGRALQHLQSRRIAIEENCRSFTDEVEAMAWLRAR